MVNCPICNKKTYNYDYALGEIWGTFEKVKEHGFCTSCGYTIEMSYSALTEGFADIKKSYRDNRGVYHKKNIRKHKRNRKRMS